MMTRIYSDTTIIRCPKDHFYQKAHFCIDCLYENGHLISDNGSYVDCGWEDEKK